jgi:esterase/lipase superfamily enzyme
MTPLSKHDRALALSRKIWGEPRLGSIDPDQEPYRSTLESKQIHVVNMTGVTSADRLNHGTFAENRRLSDSSAESKTARH